MRDRLDNVSPYCSTKNYTLCDIALFDKGQKIENFDVNLMVESKYGVSVPPHRLNLAFKLN